MTATQRPATRIPLQRAFGIASEISQLLAGSVDFCQIVGSVRRRVMMVHDVELVVVPKLLTRQEGLGLFGETETVDLLQVRLQELVKQGELAEAGKWGARYMKFTRDGLSVDLFSVFGVAQLGVALVLRTGPRDFSHQLATDRQYSFNDSANERRQGLLPSWATMRDLAIWERGVLVPMPTEEHVFPYYGLPVIPPEQRR